MTTLIKCASCGHERQPSANVHPPQYQGPSQRPDNLDVKALAQTARNAMQKPCSGPRTPRSQNLPASTNTDDVKRQEYDLHAKADRPGTNQPEASLKLGFDVGLQHQDHQLTKEHQL